MFVAFWMLLLLAGCSPPSTPAPTPQPTAPQAVGPLRAEFAADLDALPAAPRYAIDLDVNPAAARVTGQQQVRYTNAEEVPLEELYLRLFPNTPAYGGAMTVTHLLLDGQPVTPTAELGGSALRLDLEPALAPGAVVTLSMNFTVSVSAGGGLGYAQLALIDGVMSLANVYPLIPVYDDEGWNVEVAPPYGDAVYSDCGFYTVRVSAPPTETLVASGSCSVPAQGQWSCVAAPVRDFALVLRAGYWRESRVVDGVTVNSYAYPDDEEGGRLVLQVAADAVAAYTDLFGPYPYAELDVVETGTRAGGIEYPGLVVISDQLYGGGNRLEWVVAHEVAHQWWYGVVGNDQVDEPWLDEALAQYSTLLYYEATYGAETAASIVERDFVQAHQSLVATRQDRAVGLPVSAYDQPLYSSVVYRKGPLYFHALRGEVGDELFFDIMRTYYRRNRYGIATPESFLAAVQIVTGDAHEGLYEEWILGAANP